MEDLFSFFSNQDATVPSFPSHQQHQYVTPSKFTSHQSDEFEEQGERSDLLEYLDIKDFPLDISFPAALTNNTSNDKPAKVGQSLEEPLKISGKKVTANRKRKFTGPPKAKELKKTTTTPKTKKTKATKKPEALKEDFDFEDEEDDGEGDGEKSAKRQRRLMKNREAAQLFRQRQKAYIQDLEKKVTKLSAETTQSKSKVDLLTTENKIMKEQMTFLRSFLSQVMMSYSTTTGPTTPQLPFPLSTTTTGLSLPPTNPK